MKNAVAIFVSIFVLAGCDSRDYRPLYERLCRESAQIPFQQINHQSKCNGVPLLFAVAESKDPELSALLEKDSVWLQGSDPSGFSGFDEQQASTGRTPLMEAVALHNKAAARIFAAIPFDTDLKDSQGMSSLFYLAVAPPSVSRMLKIPKEILIRSIVSQREAHGWNPMQLAYQRKNFDFVWRLISLTGGRFDLLGMAPSALSPDFFFNRALEDNSQIFEGLRKQLLTVYSGPITQAGQRRLVQNFSLLHFALANQMPKLTSFLISNGAQVDLISSEGTPLSIAFEARRLNMPILDVWAQNINLLLNHPSAIPLGRNIAAALKTEDPKWVQRLVSAGAPWTNRDNLLFITDRPVYVVDAGENDRSGNSPAMQILSRLQNGDLSDSDAQLVSSDFTDLRTEKFAPNTIGQNILDFYLYTASPKNYRIVNGGFDSALRAGIKQKLFDKPDVLGMLPIHYWLASSARRISLTDADEPHRLEKLLNSTKGRAAFTANRDSILSLAVQTGNIKLVKTVITHAPELRKTLDIPNRNGLSPKAIAQDQNSKEIYAYLTQL